MQAETIATVTGGAVRGATHDGVHVFLGLPYAASIAGPNRWRAPQAVTPWDGVREATRPGQACPQPVSSDSIATRLMRWKRTGRVFLDAISNLGAPLGDDCLNLNVWTPTLDPQTKLPVLVFIHGGSFTTGGGAMPLYDGRALARAGLVVVTINYRLGAMGFVGGDDLFAGGFGVANRGFLDQVRALEWVAENIAAFGGDRDCVTVSGESAGAASVLMMAVTPATEGLIHRVISLSGAPLAYPHDGCSRLAADYFAALGVAAGDTDALTALGPAQLLGARVTPSQLLNRHPERYGALGEDRFAFLVAATQTAVFPEAPLDFVQARRRRNLDLMIGTCRDEARLWTIALPLPDALAARAMFQTHGGVMRPKHRPGKTFKAYRALMPGVSATLIRERAMTDALFRRPSVAFAGAVANAYPGRAFLYRYDWPAAGLGGRFGAIHAADLPGVFQTYDQMTAVVGPEALARPAGDALHGAVVSFVKTGTPAARGVDAWPPYDAASKACMIIDRTCTLQHDVDAGFEAIW